MNKIQAVEKFLARLSSTLWHFIDVLYPLFLERVLPPPPSSRKISRTNQIRNAIVVEEEFRPRTLGCKPRLIYHDENCKNWSYFILSDTLRTSSHFEQNSVGLYFRGIRSEATVASLRFSNDEIRIDVLLCWPDAGFFSRQHFAKDLSFHFSHPPWINCPRQIRLTSGTHIEEHNYGRGSSAMSVVISLVFLVWLMNGWRIRQDFWGWIISSVKPASVCKRLRWVSRRSC